MSDLWGYDHRTAAHNDWLATVPSVDENPSAVSYADWCLDKNKHPFDLDSGEEYCAGYGEASDAKGIYDWIKNHLPPKHAFRTASASEDDMSDYWWGQCGAFAVAHHQQFPHLRFGIDWQKKDSSHPEWEDDMVDADLDPDDVDHVLWQPQHIFTHDDTHSYDAQGGSPLSGRGSSGWDDTTLNHSLDDILNLGTETLAGKYPHPEAREMVEFNKMPPPEVVRRFKPRTASRTAAIECPQHGGDWGDDETCSTCCDYDGEPRPLPDMTRETTQSTAGHRIEREGDFWTVHDETGQGVGFLHAPTHNGHRYVNRIEISPTHSGQGMGRALWEAAGQPLHTPEQQTQQGFDWASSVGGSSWDERVHGPGPWQRNASRTAMPMMYHHTSPENADAISKERKFKPDSEYDEFTYFSDKPDGNGSGWGESRVDVNVPDYDFEYDFEEDPYQHDGGHSPPEGETFWRARSKDIKPEWIAPHPVPRFNNNPKEAHLMTAAVTVYTQPNCPQCNLTKLQLQRLGIEHDTVDVTADPEAHAYVTGLGYAAAPVVVAGEDHWSGFRPDRLKGLAE